MSAAPDPRVDQETLQQRLRGFRVGGMAKALPGRVIQARARECDYLEFLDELVTDELDKRRHTLVERRFKLSRLPCRKSLEEFDFRFNASIPKRRIMELGSARFIAQACNVLMIGPPGVGKTHLSVALGMNAILQAYTVAYRSAFDLVDELAEAATISVAARKKRIGTMVQAQLLIIDEFGMRSLPANAAEDFLEIIHRRHGKGATLIATNRPVEDWGKILGDNAATSAILDRFLDLAELIPIEGKSYRTGRKKEDTATTD